MVGSEFRAVRLPITPYSRHLEDDACGKGAAGMQNVIGSSRRGEDMKVAFKRITLITIVLLIALGILFSYLSGYRFRLTRRQWLILIWTNLQRSLGMLIFN